MGNREWGRGGAVFRQSVSDFPMMINLGEKNPDFGMLRWHGNKALRFVPVDGEGFSLRGDGRRVVYKGRRRSHRFTVLGDTAFEYDCILEREPESNVISLLMDGAEHYDFLRQPDFVRDPFLKGSYAVYKKETLLGEGTGKLCHIHRPEIIDARGRRVWGDLAVVGNVLQITIPEWWLGEAEYPVVVDPTIGTSTVGSQYIWEQEEDEFEVLAFDEKIPVNRFLVSETINGLCTAHIYTNSDDYYGGGRPVLYSDNGDKPQTRKSADESLINLRVISGSPAGWRTGSFKSNGSIASGSYVWFGIFTEYIWLPRFDYGAKCYNDFFFDNNVIPATYPIYNANWYDDFKLSMYFTYSSAQNYVRTITQGVKLTDSRKLTASYVRKATQTAGINSLFTRYTTFFLKLQETAKGIDGNYSPVEFVRSLAEEANNSGALRHIGEYARGLSDTAEADGRAQIGWVLFAKVIDTVHAAGTAFRGLGLFVRIAAGVFVRDYFLGRFLKAREELAVKSAVCRELRLESKIN